MDVEEREVAITKLLAMATVDIIVAYQDWMWSDEDVFVDLITNLTRQGREICLNERVFGVRGQSHRYG